MLPASDLSPFTDLPDEAPENDLDRLLDAVMRQRIERVTASLNAGVNPNGRGRLHLGRGRGPYTRRSPLAQAAEEGALALVDLLIEHGARPLPDEPMDPATLVIGQRLAALGWPEPAVRGTSFLAAVRRNRVDLAQLHLDREGAGWPVLADGRTPLHHLASGLGAGSFTLQADERLVELVPRLVAQGVDVNAVDHLGYTALHETLIRFHGQRASCDASWYRLQEAVVLALLDAGADVNHVSPDGSPLVIAMSQAQHVDTVLPRLLDAGARLLYPSEADAQGWPGPFDPTRMHPGSALLGAVDTGRLDTVRLALDLGEPLNRPARLFSYPGKAPFFRPVVPLERAAMFGRLDILEHLLTVGATPSAVPSEGWVRLLTRRQGLRDGTRSVSLNGRSPEEAAHVRAAQIEAIDRLEQRLLRETLASSPPAPTSALDHVSTTLSPSVRVRSRL